MKRVTEIDQHGRLDGKVILVTGAAGGQGRAAVDAFLCEGARLVGTDVGEIPVDFPADASYVQADLTESGVAADVVAQVVAQYRRLTGLYCNHAIAQRIEPMLSTSLETYDRLISVNQRSVFVINQAAGKAMSQTGGGAIVNIASSAALRPVAGLAAYSMAKAAITQLSRVLAMELAEHGIRVNVICPGAINTEMARSPTAHLPEAERRRVVEAVNNAAALKRMGEPHEVVSMGVHLLSDEASFTTGAIIAIDGGI
jgi:NAD(P)-dependent dehydrogenase (short-subunit alcohol dehydrogenase family)